MEDRNLGLEAGTDPEAAQTVLEAAAGTEAGQAVAHSHFAADKVSHPSAADNLDSLVVQEMVLVDILAVGKIVVDSRLDVAGTASLYVLSA